jgi:hypothetical protein
MQSTQQITSIKEATMTSKFFSSNRINHDCGMYHEQIFYGDDLVAFVRSDLSDGTYWWAINGGSAISRGQKQSQTAKQNYSTSSNS